MLRKYVQKQTDAAPLAIFRIGFGLLMCMSIIRFWYNGWIEKLYLSPNFFFSYYGFEWVKPLGAYTYLIFIICGISAFMIALGWYYRWASCCFFLSFTYIELMDKTTYLNHYYFISLLSFIMIFLPANAYFSLDEIRKNKTVRLIPNWTIDSVKLLLGIVYFYAGLAKINHDWLIRAMPLKIWLPSKYDLPIIGETLMQQEWFHYAMSWSGMLYDLCIPFLLLYKRTRWVAFALVVFFHVFTRILFPIGMFPFIMIVSTMIFFDASIHHRIINGLRKVVAPFKKLMQKNGVLSVEQGRFSMNRSIIIPIFAVFFSVQLLLPFRYVLYPGNLFWTEEGFRFSWRVMLMEKMGYANFKIVNEKTGASFYVNNADFLTSFQEKQMATQPDFILEYAQYLGDHFSSQGHQNVQVFVESFVALNGYVSRPFINPTVDLYQQKESFAHKNWILPFEPNKSEEFFK